MTSAPKTIPFGQPKTIPFSNSEPTPSNDTQSTPTQTPAQSFSQRVQQSMNGVSGFLGIQKAGQGLATTTNMIGGGGNAAGNTQGQDIPQYNQIIQKLHSLPLGDPKREQLLHALQNNQSASDNAPTQAQIDPGTQLSNKQVLGSFGNVGLLALSGGGLSEEGALGNVASKINSVAQPFNEASKLGKTGNAVLSGGALGYASDVAQNANNNKKNVLTPGLGTATGATLPIVNAVGGAILKRVSGMTTGVGTNVIQRAIDNPNEVGKAINQYAKNPEAKQQLVDNAKQAINNFLQDRNKQFGDSVSKMVASEPINKQTIVDSFSNAVDKFGGQIKDGELVFGDTALNNSEQSSVKNVFDTIKSWKDVTPQGMDTLRQRIGNEMSTFKVANNGRDSVILGAVKQDLTKTMNDKIPGYSDMLKNYGSKSAAARAVSKELSLGGQAKPTTQLNMVMKLFKKDPSVVKQLTKVMGEEESKSFLNDISGAILSNWIPQHGIAGKIAEGGAGAAAGLGVLMHTPGVIPAAAAGAAISSPRLVGKAATLAGKAIKSGVSSGVRKAATIGASKLNSQ